MKIDPFSEAATPLAPPETRTFSDPARPGKDFSLTLQGIDHTDILAAQEAGQKFYEAVMGDPQRGIAPTFQIPPIGGRQIRVTLNTCIYCSMVMMMQCAPQEEAYSIVQLLGIFKTRPKAWDDLAAWVTELMGASDSGNSSTEGSGLPLSEVPSSPVADIPNPSPIKSAGSTASTSEAALSVAS